MSWATHDVEPYVIRKHVEQVEKRLGFKLSFLAILIGSWAPDMMSKWFVYGIQLGGYEIRAHDPAHFHRGWPGVGFTHSLAYGIFVGVIVWLLFGRRSAWGKGWAIGLMIGIWAHVLSDTLDTNGVMLFFPITTEHVHLDVWAYAGETGRFTDARAYFSSLGFVWDGFWITMTLINWRVLTAPYFREHVKPDPAFRFLGRFMPEEGLLAVYRLAFFYGICRWTAWLIWVHVRHHTTFDLRLGGPSWVPPVTGLVSWIGTIPHLF
jgi:membrane-bound metal-dependent hydrolase YbcI (DUF457 family)